MNMKYQNRVITFLTIVVILYSFYYYNKDDISGGNGSYIEDEVSDGGAKYNLVIDPERTDLTWYEKLIIRKAKKNQEKRQSE